ncbi:transposon Ty3-I Gag-Pol polyprotein [Nephila pilipes]|uniref:Transposon Ty3-I Gag-Pol polyprotein n=1 Tax=Nephila pilipes TaxID=299642 RepID=A0A8X6MRC5_NEPPI|nr:transposon Ty3-I Gag-Pol polyprotein [Nephila pilipes]
MNLDAICFTDDLIPGWFRSCILWKTFIRNGCGMKSRILEVEISHQIIFPEESKLAVSSAADELNNCREFNYRLFVFDKKTGIKYLVDSSADMSLIPALCGDKVIGDFKLYAANGTEIPCFGHKTLTLDLGLRRDFQLPFIIAKVNKGILGADFLNRFNLLIDIKNKKIN